MKTENNDGIILLEVTSTTTYYFAPCVTSQFKNTEDLIQQWFKDFPMGRYHASRNGCQVGGSEKFVSAKIIENNP